jgi:hypothetical protein
LRHPSLKEIKSICKYEHEYVDWLEHAYELLIRENKLLKNKVDLQNGTIDSKIKPPKENRPEGKIYTESLLEDIKIKPIKRGL